MPRMQAILARLPGKAGSTGFTNRLVEKFLQLREELGISSLMLGGIDELTPVLEQLSGQ